MDNRTALADEYAHLLNDLVAVVCEAGRLFDLRLTRVIAGANPATNVDEAVDLFLRERLTRLLPVTYISEEAIADDHADCEPLWIVDPVDGTQNLISGSPDVVVSVALVSREGHGLLGVVYSPFHRTTYSAVFGRGAFLNGNRLDCQMALHSQKIISIGLPNNAQDIAHKLGAGIGRLIENGWKLRQSGSAVLDICRVADRTWRAFYEEGLYIWDIAAADLIATEAGCCATEVRWELMASARQLTSRYIVARDTETGEEVESFVD